MAYSIGKTSALQTAIKAGVDIAIAEFNAAAAAGAPLPSLLDRVQEVKDSLVGELFAQVDDDNAAVAAQPSPNRSFGSGGGQRGSNNGAVTVEEANDMVLNFGAFRGLTLRDVLAMSADEAEAYTNGKYKRAGVEWVKWCASNTDPKGAFSSARAKVALAAFTATDQTLAKLAS